MPRVTVKQNDQTKNISYLFIDGAYLDKVLKHYAIGFFKIENIELDYSQIGKKYNKVFYYHALPGRKRDEKLEDYNLRIDMKESFFNELKLLPNFHVYEGVTYGKSGRIRQKGVDVKIAMDMYQHTLKGNMNSATLLAGDLDFKPLLDGLIMEGMNTTLLYDTSSVSNELKFSADVSKRINADIIISWCNLGFRRKYEALYDRPTNFEKHISTEKIDSINAILYEYDIGMKYKIKFKINDKDTRVRASNDKSTLIKIVEEHLKYI